MVKLFIQFMHMEEALDLINSLNDPKNSYKLLSLITSNKGLKDSMIKKCNLYINKIKAILNDTDCIDTLYNISLFVYSTIPPFKIFKHNLFNKSTDSFLSIDNCDFFKRMNNFLINFTSKILSFEILQLFYEEYYFDGYIYFSNHIKICFVNKTFRINYKSITECKIQNKSLLFLFVNKKMEFKLKNDVCEKLVEFLRDKGINFKNLDDKFKTNYGTNSYKNLIKKENQNHVHESMSSSNTSTTLTISSPLKDIYIEHGIKGKNRQSLPDKASTENSSNVFPLQNQNLDINNIIREEKMSTDIKNILSEQVFNNSGLVKETNESIKETKQEEIKQMLLENDLVKEENKCVIKNESCNLKSNQSIIPSNSEDLKYNLNKRKKSSKKLRIYKASIADKKKKKDAKKMQTPEIQDRNSLLKQRHINIKDSDEKTNIPSTGYLTSNVNTIGNLVSSNSSDNLKNVTFLEDTFFTNDEPIKPRDKIKSKINKLIKEKIKYKIYLIEQIKQIIIAIEKKRGRNLIKEIEKFI